MKPLPNPYGPVLGQGVIRAQPEDFVVEEVAVCEPSGEGEHVWVKIRKRGQNTEWVARQLARLAGVRGRDVGFAGMKDRHAVTEQWFSVHLPGRADPDWAQLAGEDVQVLAVARHHRKLRRGGLLGNRFRIRVREVTADPEAVAERIGLLDRLGVPNYFGEQRFGHGGANLDKARALFEGRLSRLPRHKRALYLSAARGFLFNQVLACRIERGHWNRCLPGDVMQLDGRRGRFLAETLDEEVLARFAALEIHPTGPLCGRGRPEVAGEALAFETACLERHADWIGGLEAAGLDRDRRPLRVRAAELHWQAEAPDTLVFSFRLPAGSYATVFLGQILALEDAAARPQNL